MTVLRRRSIALALLIGATTLALVTATATNALAQESRPSNSNDVAARKELRMDLGAFWEIVGRVRSASRGDQDFLRRIGSSKSS